MTITAEHLKSMHTRELLRILRRCCTSDIQLVQINEVRGAHGLPPLDAYTSKEKYYEQAYVDPHSMGYDNGVDVQITMAELKLELSKREHVPNKQEGAALRRAKHAKGRQKGRRDR